MIRSRSVLSISTALTLIIAAGGGAYAADDNGSTQQTASPASTPWSPLNGTDDALTWKGLTLFGTVDVGVANQTHGAELNIHSAQGLNYYVGKSSDASMTQLAPNGLSPSTVGFKGDVNIAQDVDAIFRTEAGFDPLTLHLANGPQSLVDNNGRPLSAQTAFQDSNQAGQIFNTAGFVGLQSKTYGALTYGRQTGVLADRLIEYDPQGAAYAFSIVAGSNTMRGFGSSEDARMDSSIKYFNQTGPFRYDAIYEPGGQQYALFIPDGTGGSAEEVSIGGDYKNFSTDVAYAHKNDAVVASSLAAGAPQLATEPDSLAATVSDNTAYTVLGRYKFDQVKATAYVGWQRIQFANPSSPLATNTEDIGGYILSSLTQNAYTRNKVLNIYWTGAKYSLTPKLDLSGAYYLYEQNAYGSGGTTPTNVGCHTSAHSYCSGAENAESFVAAYKFVTHMDIYGGVERSAVDDGLSAGYLSNANVTSMVGVRVTF